MTVSVGTFDDLNGGGGNPVDRNPRIDCQECGESYHWQEYWQNRINTAEDEFRCGNCYAELREQAEIDRRRAQNNAITDFTQGPTEEP